MKEQFPSTPSQKPELEDEKHFSKKVQSFLDGKHELSRRQMLLGGLATAGMGALAGKKLGEGKQDFFLPETYTPREKEECEMSEVFSGEQRAYQHLYERMTKDEFLFVDTEGAPIGRSRKIEEITWDGQTLSPGERDEDGFFIAEIPQKWWDAQRAMLKREMPEVEVDVEEELPVQTNVTSILKDARDYERGQGKRFIPEHFIDVVRHFGEQTVTDAPDMNRIQYVRQNIGRIPDTIPESRKRVFAMPPAVVRELQFLVPGLAAQESQYNNDALSPVGAVRIMQFMPDTATSIGYSVASLEKLSVQVEAATKLFAQMYAFFSESLSSEFEKVTREYFDGDKEKMEKYFLIPCMINAYNAGPARLGMVVRTFLRSFPTKKDYEDRMGVYPNEVGYDVFAFMARTIGTAPESSPLFVEEYRKHSREYFSRTYALAQILEREV